MIEPKQMMVLKFMNNISQQELGRRISTYRKKKHMTLKQLSSDAGISAGFLSKIENGLCNPSISVIQRICFSLQISVNELAAVKTQDQLMSTIYKDKSYVLRKEERCLIYGFGDVFQLETIFEGRPSFKVNVMTLTAGCSEQTHCIQTCDYFGILARGRMCITLDDDTKYELDEGDCIMIRAKQKYSVNNLSDETCISYWIEILEP